LFIYLPAFFFLISCTLCFSFFFSFSIIAGEKKKKRSKNKIKKKELKKKNKNKTKPGLIRLCGELSVQFEFKNKQTKSPKFII